MSRASRLAVALGCLSLFACASGRTKGPGLVAFAPEGATEGVTRPRRLALLIGIDAFQDPRLGALRYAAADAKAMAAGLREFDEVRVLTRPEETTRPAILEAIAGLATRVRGPRDTVLVYVSSHGTLAQRAGGALERFVATADTRLELAPDTALSVDQLRRTLEAFPSRRVALVLATCHSGKGKSRHPEALAAALARLKGPLPRLEEVSEAVVLLTAAAFSEAAREDERLGHDVYTYFFLEALERGDRDGDGAVTVSEAHDFARARTYLFTEGAQRPTSETDILGSDPIVLRGTAKGRGAPVLYSYERASEGLVVLLNGTRKGAFPGGIAAEPGKLELELREEASGRQVYRGTVVLAPGESVDVSRLLPKPVVGRAALQLGAMVPFAAGVRRAFVPAAFEGALVLSVENWPWNEAGLGLRVGGAYGRGTAPGFSEDVPFDLWSGELEAHAFRNFQVGRHWALKAGAGGGFLWLGRELRLGAYRAQESLRAPLAVVSGAVRYEVAERLSIAAQLDLLAVWARLDGELGPWAVARPALGASWAF